VLAVSSEVPRFVNVSHVAPPGLPAELSEALEDLGQVSGCASLVHLTGLLNRSMEASKATTLAARALEELNTKCQALCHTKAAQLRAKRAKILVRDVLLRRCFGLQVGLLDTQKLETCLFRRLEKSDGLGSQLTNAHQKIQMHLLKELICSGVWSKFTCGVGLRPDREERLLVLDKFRWAYRASPSLQGLVEDSDDVMPPDDPVPRHGSSSVGPVDAGVAASSPPIAAWILA
jgi:hypothetical protein